MEQPKFWFAIYSRPRWEKKVYNSLLTKGFEAYCPLNKVSKKWSDRYKVVEEPLFKSYVFVRLLGDQLSDVRYVDGVVNFVYWLGSPAKVKDEDILRIKRFLNEYRDVQVQDWQPTVGDKVIITSGAFMEQEGTVISSGSKKAEVLLESLRCKLVAQVDKEKMVKKS